MTKQIDIRLFTERVAIELNVNLTKAMMMMMILAQVSTTTRKREKEREPLWRVKNDARREIWKMIR